ncbi:hypothetical protein [Acidocella sp. KAb 2-4]|uniref:hypothetical protein n=1 Tax=Acidocella sp. KAb 2-4 TaxID=2885158 RepID=UPI001D08F756|nr:hypothetical protein [Acidocella sp. KAb 2-4]MCB5944281.1 hypothetical protein [Acidocella sp. KAb 2-4]
MSSSVLRWVKASVSVLPASSARASMPKPGAISVSFSFSSRAICAASRQGVVKPSVMAGQARSTR